MSDNVPGICARACAFRPGGKLAFIFLAAIIASFVTEGMSRRVGLLFSLTAIPCYAQFLSFFTFLKFQITHVL